MKYMLMMHGAPGFDTIDAWSPEDFKAHIQFMHDFNDNLVKAGEFADAQGLTPPPQAKLVRANADGTPNTDGPFPETKEFLVGYWIVDVQSEQRALEIAAAASAAPGPGGVPLNMPIEVRGVGQAPETDA
jgi:hypothetical protein